MSNKSTRAVSSNCGDLLLLFLYLLVFIFVLVKNVITIKQGTGMRRTQVLPL